MAKEKKVTALAAPRIEEEWEKQLREQARNEKSVETLGVPRVTYKGGILQVDGKKIDGNKLRVVPLGLVYAKQWYEHEYEQGSTDTPGCYAFGRTSDKGLVPHPAVPMKQHEQCDGCPHNVFGTATKGRGKRCSDLRRVLFLLADDLARGNETKTPEEWQKVVAKAPAYQISVPPGSLKAFGQYLASLKEVTPHENLREAVTEITTAPNPNGAFTVEFRFLDPVPVAAMPALLKRGEGAYDLLAQPFPVISSGEEEKKSVKGQQTKRK